nr:MAG TPA: hypothetical protein [Herelleviridae sp.]
MRGALSLPVARCSTRLLSSASTLAMRAVLNRLSGWPPLLSTYPRSPS